MLQISESKAPQRESKGRYKELATELEPPWPIRAVRDRPPTPWSERAQRGRQVILVRKERMKER